MGISNCIRQACSTPTIHSQVMEASRGRRGPSDLLDMSNKILPPP